MARKGHQAQRKADTTKLAVKVYVFEFTKAELSARPADERALLLLAGHTLNLLGFWIKLIALATREDATNPVLDKLNAAQSHILLRSLASLAWWRSC